MTKRALIAICVSLILIMIIGCGQIAVQEPAEEPTVAPVKESADIMEEADAPLPEAEPEPVAEEPEEVVVEPVDEPPRYTQPE